MNKRSHTAETKASSLPRPHASPATGLPIVALTPASTSSSSSSSSATTHLHTPLELDDQSSGPDDMDTARENQTGGEPVAQEQLTQAEPPTAGLDAGTEAAVAELDPSSSQLAIDGKGTQKKKKKNKTKNKAQCAKHGMKKSECCPAERSASKGADGAVDNGSSEDDDTQSENEESSESDSDSQNEKEKRKLKKKKALKKKKKTKAKKRKSKKNVSSSEDSSDDSSSSDSDSDSSDDEKAARRKRKAKKAKKAKAAKKRKGKKDDLSSEDSSSDSSSSDSDSDSSEDERSRRKRKSKKSRKADDTTPEETETEDVADPPAADEDIDPQITAMSTQIQQLQLSLATLAQTKPTATSSKKKSKKAKGKKPGKKGSMLEYKRVDQLWDSTIHNYKLTESAEEKVDEFDEYVFTVRRKFDWENKYRNTVVDIKSKPLRDALQEVMKGVKGVSLVEESPSVDPNMLFLYLEELKTYYRKVLKVQLKKEKKKKLKKRLALQIAHCKLLAAYLDEDYEETKKTLYPMLKAGNITFDLLWALFKPNTIAFTSTYGNNDIPRCFKVDYATKESHFMKGEWYRIEGRYLEYDGKVFGMGDYEVSVEAFKGARKITSLSTYPLHYHKDPDGVKKLLVERGQKFVALQGMNYRFHKGMAFRKVKKTVQKVNTNGRVMVDPAIFRRINPNYPIAYMNKRDEDNPFEQSDDESGDGDDGCCCGGDSDDESEVFGAQGPLNYEDADVERTMVKLLVDGDKVRVVHVPVDAEGNEIMTEKLDVLGHGRDVSTFSEEELLLASPVVLGFAFSEKLWLEFSLSGINEIEWNKKAFSSLVLPTTIKSNLKGLVGSHKFHAAKTIDDVVQGKGRGLNVVLHGPPGVGKTLTAEGIAEYLKCPLYSVSAGELGTDSRNLEYELNKIMDVAHSWGAVLLLDEADVFLERREIHDIHRNALVSIFLRQLEYYQGILFLTTNRVETFDPAFQSRIHMGIKYENLNRNARRKVWMEFVDMVKAKVDEGQGQELIEFTDEDFVELSKKELNGRQIKNAAKTAQSIALSEEQPFSMEHVRRVLEVAEDFDADFKGGTGYRDAMRQYT